MRERLPRGSAGPGENRHQLLRGNDFQLCVGAVTRLLVRPPSSKVRQVAEAGALHMFVSDFDYQLGPQRLPRQVLALAPAALAARHAMPGFAGCGIMLRPALPGVIGESVLAIGREVFRELMALLF